MAAPMDVDAAKFAREEEGNVSQSEDKTEAESVEGSAESKSIRENFVSGT